MKNKFKMLGVDAAVLFATMLLLQSAPTIAAVDVPALAEYVKPDSRRPGLHTAASRESDQVQAKVFVTKRRRRGALMDVNFRIEFSSVPHGKAYKQCFLDMGMKRNGVNKASCFGAAVKPDAEGKIVIHFEATDMSPGEWVQLTIRSTDGRVQKSVRFVPYK